MASQAAILKKVRALIARSASDSESEARTSAFLACKLIREHGLVVTGKKAAARRKKEPVSKAPQRGPAQAPGNSWWGDMFDDFFEDLGHATRVDPFARPKRDSEVHFTTARFAGRCSKCHKPISIGEQVAYYPAERLIYHAETCATEAASEHTRKGKRV